MKSAKSAKTAVPGPVPTDFRGEAHTAARLLASLSASGVRQARRHVMAARALARDGSPQERALATAMFDWWRGRRDMALRALVTLAESDADAAMWACHLACALGDRAVLAQVSSALVASRPDLPVAHALIAYALAQQDRLDEAQARAARALAMDANQPLAQLVLAQLHERGGNVDAGLALLQKGRPGWRSRVWRHALLASLARLHLLAGQLSDALEILDHDLLPAAQTDARALQDVIALIWLLEMNGVDAGERWRAVADIVQARWHEHIHPLLDLHFVFALARDGRDQAVRAFIASMERVGEADNSGLWQSVVIPVARGLVSLADGNRASAVVQMEPAMPRLPLIGGSHQARACLVQAFARAMTTSGVRRSKVSARQPSGMQAAP